MSLLSRRPRAHVLFRFNRVSAFTMYLHCCNAYVGTDVDHCLQLIMIASASAR